jgi:transcriptional regulator with XRE-family HTH domain
MADLAKIEKIVSTNVAKNIKKLRRLRGYKSASAFARDNDIPIQTYLNWESGKRGTSIGVIIFLSKLLCVNYSEIIGGYENVF